MALTVGRWIAIAVIGCVTLAVAYLPPEPKAPRALVQAEALPEAARLNLLSGAYGRAKAMLNAVRFRDSLSRVVRSGSDGSHDVTVVIAGSAVSDSARRAFRGAVDHVWRRVRPLPEARLVVLLDVAAKRFVAPRYVLPSALDGRTCAAALTLDYSVEWLRTPPSLERGENLEPWLFEQLGPCLYYSAFGLPGPAIERWLQQRSYRLANVADWQGPPPTLRVLDDANALNNAISDMSFDALACTDGRLERCRRAIFYDSRRWDVPVGLRLKTAEIPGYLRRVNWPRNFLGEDRYLSTLVHDMGRDRFGRFWHATTPVDSAFAAAFGASMDRWTRDWARTVVPGVPPLGPIPRGRAFLLAVLVGALALGLMLGLVHRRQISSRA
jgi:hypothetical protein